MHPKAAPLRLLATVGLATLLGTPAWAESGDTKMFTLDSVTFNGNHRVSTETLNAIDGLTIGQKVNRDGIVNAFNNVIAEYKKDNVGGSIQPTMQVVGSSHLKVVFDITEEAPAAAVKVAPILAHETATGNVKVSSATLAPALTIKPGTGVTTEMVKADLDAIGALYKHAQVNVSITPKITNLPEGKIDINFEIVESKPKEE